jgi:ubiquinone/menaquinone biosynthesis C-methylase UbiE
MSQSPDRISEQINLWNRRALKDGVKTVMCSDFSDAEAHQADQMQKDVIKTLIDTPKASLGLEIGSGFGRLTNDWLNYVDSIVTLDISEVMLTKMSKQPTIHPVIGDLVQLPFRGNSFEAIFVSNVLGHLNEDRDLVQAISEIDRVSTSNSTLFIDEMTGNEGELIAGHYKIRNPNTTASLLMGWGVQGRTFYNFGRQPHAATIFKKL